MEQIRGKSILNRIAIGRIRYYKKEKGTLTERGVADIDLELSRYDRACDVAETELNALYEKACAQVGKANAAVFKVHSLMIRDADFRRFVVQMIAEQGVNAEEAVTLAGDHFCRMFSELEDDYFKERAADIRDISDRLVRILSGIQENAWVLKEPVIVAACDLAPSETVQMDKNMLLGFVTEQGSSNSHTAILARSMGIPALVSVPVKEEWDGKMAVIDGEDGVLYLDPDEKTIRLMEEKMASARERERLLLELREKEDVTADGTKIRLYGNIGGEADVDEILKYNGAGIGLFRTEFLYLEKETYPTEEEQYQVYRRVAERMNGREVIIRTLDIGADKQADYLGLEREENPALGFRAIRICLKRPDMFKTQLRAIYRAGMYGNIAVMFPMITSLRELKRAKELVEEVKGELMEQGIPFRNIPLGIMIETPAAAIMSGELAKEVDFFSIGTNDLTQYVLAIDRQNEKLDEFYDPHHPAVMKLIGYVAECGHAEGCTVGICGELAADTHLTETFLKLGIDELSVSPSFLLPVRQKIRHISLNNKKEENVRNA